MLQLFVNLFIIRSSVDCQNRARCFRPRLVRLRSSGPPGVRCNAHQVGLGGCSMASPPEPSWKHTLFGSRSSIVTPPSRPKTHQVPPGASAALFCADCGDEIQGNILMFMDRAYCCQRCRYQAAERAERGSRVERGGSPDLQLSEGGGWRSNRWI